MAIPITIPRLGWNMEEGTFVGWLKEDGAAVSAGDAVFTLESDKATQDIECLDSGTLRIGPHGPQAGARVAVGTVIGYLLQPGEAFPVAAGAETRRPVAARGAAGSHPGAGPAARRLARQRGIDLRKVTGRGSGARIAPEDLARHNAPISAGSSRPTISPRARRVADELGIDWTGLRGTGRTGRIRERDVRAAAAGRTTQPAPGTAIPHTSIRKTIAERLTTSHRVTAPVTLTTTADAANLVNLRQQFRAATAHSGDLVPSYTVFVVKLVAGALRQHPLLNASWSDEQILVHKTIDIGFAVDTEAGLLVPVLRDVPSLSLKQLTARERDLVERAQQRQLVPDDLSGGTFTVTNLGACGIDAFTPLLNYPQCAILGVGRIQRRPAAVGDQIVARDQVTLSLTFDHRMIDGAPAARFLQTLTQMIENPGPWLMP
jgi:pyruvate dehydrogenase E2 component (dihydrolipoamide acetyltransferase)